MEDDDTLYAEAVLDQFEEADDGRVITPPGANVMTIMEDGTIVVSKPKKSREDSEFKDMFLHALTLRIYKDDTFILDVLAWAELYTTGGRDEDEVLH